MGNVMAATAPPPPPSPLIPPTELAAPVKSLKSDPKDGIENPGTIEELHKKCKDVFPNCFDGARLVISKGLSSHFQISHTINLSNVSSNGYRFGTTFVGNNKISPTESFPILLGDIDPAGNLNANIIHQIGKEWRFKVQTQVQNSKFAAMQYTTDYRGENFTGSLTLANANLFDCTGVAVLHYLQSFTSKLALGSELVYQSSPQIPGGHIAVLSLVARYATKNYVVSGTLGAGGTNLCYWGKASEQLQFGVEFETNFRSQEATTTFAYQVDLPRTDFLFRGSVDSNWNIGGVLEKRLNPLPAVFALSGTMNQTNSQFKLGAGIIIG